MEKPNNMEFQKFDDVTRAVLAVSKDELQRREIAYKKHAASNPKKRGPKGRVKTSFGPVPVALPPV